MPDIIPRAYTFACALTWNIAASRSALALPLGPSSSLMAAGLPRHRPCTTWLVEPSPILSPNTTSLTESIGTARRRPVTRDGAAKRLLSTVRGRASQGNVVSALRNSVEVVEGADACGAGRSVTLACVLRLAVVSTRKGGAVEATICSSHSPQPLPGRCQRNAQYNTACRPPHNGTYAQGGTPFAGALVLALGL